MKCACLISWLMLTLFHEDRMWTVTMFYPTLVFNEFARDYVNFILILERWLETPVLNKLLHYKTRPIPMVGIGNICNELSA
jgi:hypothetical protein